MRRRDPHPDCYEERLSPRASGCSAARIRKNLESVYRVDARVLSDAAIWIMVSALIRLRLDPRGGAVGLGI
jgi:hypothetical protein